MAETFTPDDVRGDRAKALAWITAALSHDATDPALYQVLADIRDGIPADRMVWAMAWLALRCATVAAEALDEDSILPLLQDLDAENRLPWS